MQTASEQDVRKTLGVGGGRRRWRRWIGAAAVLALASVAAGTALRTRQREPLVRYQTAPVSRETLTITVTATGNLGSLTQVNVGTEISGVVDKVYVDYNAPVTVGQLLATINTDKLKAQAAQAQAALDSSRAKRMQTEATLEEGRTRLERLRRMRDLTPQQDLDTQEATVKRAAADDASAAAQVVQAEATLSAIDTDVRKAEVRSPIKGIVLDRAVDPGQTVAASFQTPTLFTLAEDLARMKLIVDVDEADVGNVKAGQTATFRVDAYPDKRFASRVVEVRNTPKTANGVVTYQAVLAVDNAALSLKPGMTATAEVTVTRIANALVVPNAALRFTPPQAPPADTRGFSLLPRPPVQARYAPDASEAGAHQVWVLRDGQPSPVEVATGPSDGRLTQITGGPLDVGATVVVDTVSPAR
jgi:HlyD family secretion protein